jgi:hypothetical protein
MVGGDVSNVAFGGRLDCGDVVDDNCLAVGDDAATGFPGPELVRPPCPLPFTLNELFTLRLAT